MVTTCPPKWKSMSVRKKCEMMNHADPLTTLPITSHKTGITYRNTHCALCHNDISDDQFLDFWTPRVECPSLLQSLTKKSDENLTNSLNWNNEKQQWGLTMDNQWHPCNIDPVIPETSNHIVRRCMENTIHTCAVNWTNSEVRDRCEAYTSLVYEGSTAYRNPHCAVCNNVPLQSLTCFKITHRSFYNKEFSPNAFSILFDLTGPEGAVGKVKPCMDHQLYDPFFRRCRDVFCPITEKYTKNSTCVVVEEKDEDEYDVVLIQDPENDTINEVSAFRRCPKFLLAPEDYEFIEDNKTVYISAYDKYFTQEEYKINEDESLEICVGTLGTRLVNKFGEYMGWVTAIGLGISIIFLILHLIAFIIVPDLQNLSGKNLASLCVALLIANCSFLSGQSISTGTDECIASGVITYYGYLTSFFWMLTMAFDIWRTLKIATFELRVSSGKQWKKFICYSLWSWLIPGIITVIAVAADMSPIGNLNIYIRPLFGVHSCWFGHRQALLIFFALPLAIIMILNIIFFSSSAHMIFSTTSTTRYTASGATQRDFRLYIRLALVMGLTWITGLLGGYLDIDALWYTFIALNTLQGLFIFLAFTCNDKVIRGVKETLCNKWEFDTDPSDMKERRPPSFSWSGGSSDSTNKSNLGSSSDEGSKHRNYEQNAKMNYDTAPRSKAFEDRIGNDYDATLRNTKRFESPFNTINSAKDKMIDVNTKIAYDSAFCEKNYEIFPKINYSSHPHYGINPKINPIYGSTKKISKNTSYDRRHLEDTLY